MSDRADIGMVGYVCYDRCVLCDRADIGMVGHVCYDKCVLCVTRPTLGWQTMSAMTGVFYE